VLFNGALLVDKNSGPTTAYITRKISRLLGIKAGHAGTLDPLATGLAIVLLGKTTKLQRYFTAFKKSYTGTARLGIETDSGDSQGKIVEEYSVEIEPESIYDFVGSLTGKQMQIPPIFSALRYRGKRAYKLARNGQKVELQPREIEIFAFEIDNIRLPYLDFKLEVSSGTYVRSIIQTLGQQLGCGAHVCSLRRETIGSIDVKSALSFEETRDYYNSGRINEIIRKPIELMSDMPILDLDKNRGIDISHGKHIHLSEMNFNCGQKFAFAMDNRLLAIARWVDSKDKEYVYERVLIGPGEV